MGEKGDLCNTFSNKELNIVTMILRSRGWRLAVGKTVVEHEKGHVACSAVSSFCVFEKLQRLTKQ